MDLNAKIRQQLLASRPSPHINRRAIHQLAYIKDDRLTNLLLRSGADPNLKVSGSQNGFCYALSYHKPLAKTLYDAGASLDGVDKEPKVLRNVFKKEIEYAKKETERILSQIFQL